MSVTQWVYSAWFILDLLMCIAGMLLLVIGGMNRESENRVRDGEVIRQVIGHIRRSNVRRARAREQVLLEDQMADIRAERERARR